MAGISGAGTTFNLPNYVGELFRVSPADTPFLSSIGGLTGGEAANATLFTWETYDLRDASDARQRVEGANAPTAEARVRATVRNVLEIHQEALDISYTKLAATGQVGSTGSSHPYADGAGGSNPVTDEVNWQLAQHLLQVARDVEASFITGTFNEPANNSTARRTKGIVEAIATNAVDADDTEVTKDMLLDLLQEVWESGGIMIDETRTIMCAGAQKRALTDIFVSDGVYRQDSRTVGGVAVDTILTDFGTLNVMLNRHVPSDVVLVVSLEQCSPMFLEIPGKGHFFTEPLAKSGAQEKFQIYGEIGLKYGNEITHGKITNLGGYGS
jgi:hypothetical protein